MKRVCHLAAHYDMISSWVYRHASDAPRAPNQLLGQPLLGQVVHSDVILGGDKEERLERVEQHPHHPTPVLPEGVLGCVLGELMH